MVNPSHVGVGTLPRWQGQATDPAVVLSMVKGCEVPYLMAASGLKADDPEK
jgi:hypothetical protein